MISFSGYETIVNKQDRYTQYTLLVPESELVSLRKGTKLYKVMREINKIVQGDGRLVKVQTNPESGYTYIQYTVHNKKEADA